jgi:hypothetical protein
MTPAEAVQRVEIALDVAKKIGKRERRSMLATRAQAADSWRRADTEEIDRKREGEGCQN